ncbi:MAG: hypothetical protein HRU18_11185 [Pseudoalteromonas sp.]|uniref:hypothetical protein n=1 Tax=Pseudoalteromonas sp. TaxID=53249 RepID=UPI001E0CD022|nr:hypothetical protein [Pseudoalteromonas sp.]NRA78763.1 hypothetical protein [Pseudoalteromonas sp.]
MRVDDTILEEIAKFGNKEPKYVLMSYNDFIRLLVVEVGLDADYVANNAIEIMRDNEYRGLKLVATNVCPEGKLFLSSNRKGLDKIHKRLRKSNK